MFIEAQTLIIYTLSLPPMMEIRENMIWIKGYLDSLIKADRISKEQIQTLELNLKNLITIIKESDIEYYLTNNVNTDESFDDELDYIDEPEQLYNFIEKESPDLTRDDLD